MKKFLCLVLSLLMLLSLSAVAFAETATTEEATTEAAEAEKTPEELQAETYTLIDTTVPSTIREGAEIPTYITLPVDYDAANEYELVIMIHGHGGNHNEWGGFDAISNGLAENGQIVVTLDFPGCGASTESFRLNTMTNMTQDVMDVIGYMCSNYTIHDVNAFGYSMGGRIVLQLLAEKRFGFDSVELVAPAEDTEDLKNLFGGAEAWETMKATAEADGYVEFTTIYGQTQELSKEWFEDLEAYPDGLAEAAAENFTGPMMVIYATNDEAVSPAVSQAVADVFDATVINTYTGGHSYSFYCTDPAVVAIVNGCSMAFFLSIEDSLHIAA